MSTPTTSPLANAFLESIKVHAQAASRKSTDLSADEEFALLHVAGVPMKIIRTGDKLQLTTAVPCLLTRQNDKWHVVIGRNPPTTPPF
jgi:hypothetical protein